MTARILIVDDVPANTRLMEAKLAAEYYQTTSARDGDEALRVARDWQPDLVLLDGLMRGLNGSETCRLLKADEATMHIPVVMLSGLSDPDERLRGLEAGADDVLTKPVDDETLLARLRSLVRLKRVLDELRARGETARALGLTGDPPAPPSVAGARALVIDDYEPDAQVIQDALELDGIIGGRAASEAEAAALTAAIAFDLIVLNLSMTGDDALRLVSGLRAVDATHTVPVLLIADPEQRDRILRGLDLGANDWLMRPVDTGELRIRARNQIRRKFYQDRLRADLGHALDMALTDPLTGFYNQRYITRHVTALLASAQPNGIAALMVDIDHFKLINDRWGHSVGDNALKAIAEVLRSRSRVLDSIARYGGEEFVVVIPGAIPGEAHGAAERLRSAVERMRFEPEPGLAHPLTVSIGVAFSSSRNATAEQVFRSADAALARAKRAGRNRVELEAPT